MNTVQNDSFVSIEYTLTIGSGEVVDRSEPGRPLGFIAGRGQVIRGLEGALLGRAAGETFSVNVAAENGYGEVDEEMLQNLPRKNFPEGASLEAGTVFQAQTPHGPVSFRVREVLDDEVVVDFNHPLAGEELHFDVKVIEVREATDADFEKLHSAHGCDGSHGCGGCCG